jgi:ClpP class serine protease
MYVRNLFIIRILYSSFCVGLYLRKVRKGNRIFQGLPVKDSYAGKRVAVINAVGGIGSGRSSGNNLGSDTIIEMVRRAKRDPGVGDLFDGCHVV